MRWPGCVTTTSTGCGSTPCMPSWTTQPSTLFQAAARGRRGGGGGLDASWADEWHHALHAALTGDVSGYYEDFGSLALLAKALRQAWVYDGTYSPHRQRVDGRPPTGLTGSQFVVCAQNHDQIGNRAAGERAGALMSDGGLRGAAALP